MTILNDRDKIDKILDDAEDYVIKNNEIDSAGIRYACNPKHIYSITIPNKYEIHIGAFGDFSIYNPERTLEDFWMYILKPSFKQKRRMKLIWRIANDIYKDKEKEHRNVHMQQVFGD